MRGPCRVADLLCGEACQHALQGAPSWGSKSLTMQSQCRPTLSWAIQLSWLAMRWDAVLPSDSVAQPRVHR